MLLCYFDEVKYDPPKQNFFWVGGVALNIDCVPNVEAQLNAIADDVFGSHILRKETEFHGKEIAQGKGNFKGVQLEDRVCVIDRLLRVIHDEKNGIWKLYVKIIPENMVYTSQDPADVGFMYFVERADTICGRQKCLGMLFGDYDEPVIGSSVASLSRFRRGGTDWRQGRDINRLVDTVHFAKSHHSRLVQLADVFLYCMQFRDHNNEAPWRQKILQVIEQYDLHQNCSFKIWPPDKTWWR